MTRIVELSHEQDLRFRSTPSIRSTFSVNTFFVQRTPWVPLRYLSRFGLSTAHSSSDASTIASLWVSCASRSSSLLLSSFLVSTSCIFACFGMGREG